jgi:hypothetical protein
MASRSLQEVHRAAAVGAAIVLLLSWAGLLHTGEFISWSLAPYDTTPLALRPPPGTWEREVSDFLEAPPGSTSVGVLIVGLSVLLFVIALRRVSRSAGTRTRLMAGFAASNVLVGVAVFLSIFVAGVLPLEAAPYPGYGWTCKFLVPQALLLAILYTLQAHTIPKSLATPF